jgi:hypothetical protein
MRDERAAYSQEQWRGNTIYIWFTRTRSPFRIKSSGDQEYRKRISPFFLTPVLLQTELKE